MKYKIIIDEIEEFRRDTGNANYYERCLNTWYRIYKGKKLIESFRNRLDAEKARAKWEKK